MANPKTRSRPKVSAKSQPKAQLFQTLNADQRRGFFLLTLGSLLILVFIAYRIQQSLRLSFAVKPDPVTQLNRQSRAKSINLPKYKVTLDVVESAIIDGVWQISDLAANHLNTSANPGEAGNIILYGHNSREVFGPLRWMSVGEEIELISEAGEKKTYRIEQIIETKPSDIQWVLPTDKEVLTLYTCSGFLNSKRHILVARPIGD